MKDLKIAMKWGGRDSRLIFLFQRHTVNFSALGELCNIKVDIFTVFLQFDIPRAIQNYKEIIL